MSQYTILISPKWKLPNSSPSPLILLIWHHLISISFSPESYIIFERQALQGDDTLINELHFWLCSQFTELYKKGLHKHIARWGEVCNSGSKLSGEILIGVPIFVFLSIGNRSREIFSVTLHSIAKQTAGLSFQPNKCELECTFAGLTL